ncbi:hypothetical protein [Micromonospora endolithica]|uniref:hypothetical protein n=1 Tax=Micromonospora endolithica TaxID=230091 RepID=UPI0011AD98CD|nr:hypothetical protein [Micromonospora endolithica]TWJ25996.1 hypothetical protein JD76_06174 [Micromonospora endolithica]
MPQPTSAATVLDRIVGHSPVVRVSLPSTPRERLVPLTVEQVRALAAAMPARNHAMADLRERAGFRR